MVALGALEVSKLPLWPECQHPGTIVGERKLHNPRRNDKVYICSLRIDRRALIQSLQFYLSWRLHCQILLKGDSTGKETWLSEVFTQEGFQTLILQRWLAILKGFWEEVALKETKVFLICKELHLFLLEVLSVLQVLILIRKLISPSQYLDLKLSCVKS